jgi:hypothetical protein
MFAGVLRVLRENTRQSGINEPVYMKKEKKSL